MERVPITSSAIFAAGWEDDEMEVEFVGGDIYRAEGISEGEWQEFLNSLSPGRYFATVLRPTHTFVKV